MMRATNRQNLSKSKRTNDEATKTGERDITTRMFSVALYAL